MKRPSPIAWGIVAAAIGLPQGAATQEPGVATCPTRFIEGRVEAGEAFEASLTDELVFRLVPEANPRNPPGWTIRVTPTASRQSDYAMVATPPYRFWNPRYVNTSYGTTAEEALSMTPRSFAFVATRRDYEAASRALEILLWPASQTETAIDSARNVMDGLSTHSATFSIQDGVASQPDSVHTNGVILWMSFRMEFCTPGK